MDGNAFIVTRDVVGSLSLAAMTNDFPSASAAENVHVEPGVGICLADRGQAGKKEGPR